MDNNPISSLYILLAKLPTISPIGIDGNIWENWLSCKKSLKLWPCENFKTLDHLQNIYQYTPSCIHTIIPLWLYFILLITPYTQQFSYPILSPFDINGEGESKSTCQILLPSCLHVGCIFMSAMHSAKFCLRMVNSSHVSLTASDTLINAHNHMMLTQVYWDQNISVYHKIV